MINSSKNFVVRICDVGETVALLTTVSDILYGDMYKIIYVNRIEPGYNVIEGANKLCRYKRASL